MGKRKVQVLGKPASAGETPEKLKTPENMKYETASGSTEEEKSHRQPARPVYNAKKLLLLTSLNYDYRVLSMEDTKNQFPKAFRQFEAQAIEFGDWCYWVGDARNTSSFEEEASEVSVVKQFRIRFSAIDGGYTKIFTSLAAAKKRAAGHEGDGYVSADGISRISSFEVRGVDQPSWVNLPIATLFPR